MYHIFIWFVKMASLENSWNISGDSTNWWVSTVLQILQYRFELRALCSSKLNLLDHLDVWTTYRNWCRVPDIQVYYSSRSEDPPTEQSGYQESIRKRRKKKGSSQCIARYFSNILSFTTPDKERWRKRKAQQSFFKMKCSVSSVFLFTATLEFSPLSNKLT